MGKKSSLFGTSTFGLQDVAGATAHAPKGQSALSDDQMGVLDLAQRFGVAVPNMNLAIMSNHAVAETFDGIKAALKRVMMDSPQGREILGAAIIEPLRKEQDYKSQLRKAFKQYVLGAGQENHIPLDIDVQAFTTSTDGYLVTQTPYGLDGVEAPLQRIETKVLFHIADIRKGKFDLIGRAKEKSESSIFKEEDRRIANLFAQVAASPTSNTPIAVTVADFKANGLYTVIDAVALIEGNEGLTLVATDLWMNPAHKQTFRRVNNYANGFQVSFNQAEELVKRGIIADFQGLRINASAVVPKAAVYITCEPETFGGFVESLPLMVIDTVEGAQVGFIILEEVGMVLTNPKGLSTIAIS